MLFDIHEPGETPELHAEDIAAVGIDLGTTNTVVAYSKDSKPEILCDETGNRLIPSIYKDSGLEIASIKRLMGKSGKEAASLNLAYEIANPDSSELVRIKIGNKILSPVEISAEILKVAKHRAENAIGRQVGKAVITVPAYFDDASRLATKDAARLAGIEVMRLIAEPTASALAYGLDNASEGLYAVYDLGGGTFDFSILNMKMGVFQVIATGGDAALGGDDFDSSIADKLYAGLPRAESLQRARRVKELLSTTDEFEGLSRSEFESLIEPFVARTIAVCKRVIKDAAVDKKEIKGVVLVGGSTRVPLVRKKVEELFGKKPLDNVNPDEVVAAGAAISAENLTKGSGTLLLDVTPLSLGIETMGGIVEKIIYRNTPIPAALAQNFTTYKDNQNGIIIHVVQGEREQVKDCRSLARFELKNIPPLPAGVAKIKVVFNLDADGILNVSASEELTGISQSIEVKPSYGLKEGEIESMLIASMENAKQDMESRLLAESKINAQQIIDATKKAISESNSLLKPNEEQDITSQIKKLEIELAGSDRNIINNEVRKLEEITHDFAVRKMNSEIGGAMQGTLVKHYES